MPRALPLIGLALLLIVAGLVYLGSTTPAPTQVPYEKTVDVAR